MTTMKEFLNKALNEENKKELNEENKEELIISDLNEIIKFANYAISFYEKAKGNNKQRFYDKAKKYVKSINVLSKDLNKRLTY